jgi:AraC-like DNA-binding protein
MMSHGGKMLPIIRQLFLPRLYNCGFVPAGNTKGHSDPQMLDFTMDSTVGSGFCQVFPVGGSMAICIMDMTYHKEVPIVWPQPEFLHLHQELAGNKAFYAHIAYGETWRKTCVPGERVHSVGVSLMPDYYKDHLKTTYDISPQVLVQAFSELDGSIVLPDAAALLKQLGNIHIEGKPGLLCREGKVLELISCILRWHSQKEQFVPEGIHEDDRVSIGKVLAYIQKHYSIPITISTLSRIACMSKSKLSYLFKQVTGTTISGYIRDVRLNAAKLFLAEKEYDICQIARSVGFKRPASFTAIFRETVGLTPGAYRTLVRQEVLPQ